MRLKLRGFVAMLGILFAVGTVTADDTTIASEIAKNLRHQQQEAKLDGFRISVKVDKGTVWISGDVADMRQRDLALDVARRVDGVRLVVNDLSIGGSSSDAAASDSFLIGAQQPVGSAVARPVSAAVVPRDQTPQAASAPQYVPDAHPVPPRGVAPLAVTQPSYPQTANRPDQQGIRMASGCYDGTCQSAGVVSGGAYYGGGEVVGGVGYASNSPQLPGYAWPSYASYPNYGALAYPQQYSPQAWPYIGPFYPYPQVPLGWRKVSLEWDDGWWMLDFSAK